MLNAYDLAKEWSSSHKVRVLHGKVGEAVVRDWLTRFLPKRYGVTSGYIVSPGIKNGEKTPHYDVIIYDVLNSPTLWVEASPDVSQQGRANAIPVEYVHCVIEVKSSFSLRNVREALAHLNELKPFLGAVDDEAERYKLYLPRDFCCGLLFFELKKKDQFNAASLETLSDGENLKGFFGAILRGEELDETGRLELLTSEKPSDGLIGKNKGSLLSPSNLVSGKSSEVNGLNIMPILHWNSSQFAIFAFNLIARMQGTYEVNRVSSFHGLVGRRV